MCRYACPVAEAEASEAATPTWKGALALQWLEGKLPLAGAVAEAAYKCTDCLLSREACLWKHEVPEVYEVVRAAAVAEGAAPERVRTYVERVRRLGNPFEAELGRRLLEAVPAEARLAFAAAAPLALFPGCTAARHDPGLVRAARAVFERVEGAPLRVSISAASCCGYPLYAAGDLAGFAEMAKKAAGALAGVAEVLSPDPGCVHTMNALWGKVGVRWGGRARTLVERLAERIDAVRAAVVRPAADAPIAYHDPCFLGRYRGVYDAPRALLAAASGGRAPRELSWARERAWCSGAGAIYAKVEPAHAGRIRDRRLAELAESGAPRLATACPSAARMLGKGLPADRPVEDVVVVLARAMGLGG